MFANQIPPKELATIGRKACSSDRGLFFTQQLLSERDIRDRLVKKKCPSLERNLDRLGDVSFFLNKKLRERPSMIYEKASSRFPFTVKTRFRNRSCECKICGKKCTRKLVNIKLKHEYHWIEKLDQRPTPDISIQPHHAYNVNQFSSRKGIEKKASMNNTNSHVMKGI